MASINITIPDAVAPRVLDAMAAQYGWTAESGLTKAQFAKSIIVKMLKDVVRAHEGTLAAQAATESSNQQVDSDILIT